MTPELNRIYQGDCLVTLSRWDDNSVDLVITSPPYNLGNNHHTGNKKTQAYTDDLPEGEYQQQQIDVLNELFRVSSGDLFYNHQHRFKNGRLIRPCDWLSKTKWTLRQEIVWHRGSPNMDKCRFFPFTERIYWLTKIGTDTKFENILNLTDDWHLSPVGSSGVHTRAFPYEIPARIIGCVNSKIILDPYMGSGTVGLAALRGGRKFVGCEMSETYLSLANERLGSEMQQEKLF